MSCRDLCVATPAGFRDPAQRPWEDRTQPLVPALDDTGDPLGGPADIPGESGGADLVKVQPGWV
jgi:hypothetical protein